MTDNDISHNPRYFSLDLFCWKTNCNTTISIDLCFYFCKSNTI